MARPRKEDQIDIRQAALEAALKLAEQQSLDSLSLKDVAAAVGCRTPALYRYFANKESLLLAIHDEGFKLLYAYKNEAAINAGDNPLERLRLGGLAYIRFALENPALYELMFHLPGPRRALNERLQENPFSHDDGLRTLSFLQESIRQCQAAGYLKEIPVELAAFTLWSSVHGMASLILQGRSPLAPDGEHQNKDPMQLAEEAVDLIIQRFTE
ncbi:TetR/AcrR family transcriptional regulator [Hahella ganghwensis]|uniref:TetR/AcrR family transcriptional regulator n=1 Tax=Hahella ganghwensis TaxID=286420 RepID=UPI00037B0959|nr:TetR/AcrR family transcriptional regulator [Hahella ganghwensis]